MPRGHLNSDVIVAGNLVLFSVVAVVGFENGLRPSQRLGDIVLRVR